MWLTFANMPEPLPSKLWSCASLDDGLAAVEPALKAVKKEPMAQHLDCFCNLVGLDS